MSKYGRIHESITTVRKKLADTLGVPSADLSWLHRSIRLASELEVARAKRIGELLATWAELEAEAAKLDPETGNEKSR